MRCCEVSCIGLLPEPARRVFDLLAGGGEHRAVTDSLNHAHDFLIRVAAPHRLLFGNHGADVERFRVDIGPLILHRNIAAAAAEGRHAHRRVIEADERHGDQLPV